MESLSTQTPLPQKEAQGLEDKLEALHWAPGPHSVDWVGLRPLKPPFLYVLSETRGKLFLRLKETCGLTAGMTMQFFTECKPPT